MYGHKIPSYWLACRWHHLSIVSHTPIHTDKTLHPVTFCWHRANQYHFLPPVRWVPSEPAPSTILTWSSVSPNLDCFSRFPIYNQPGALTTSDPKAVGPLHIYLSIFYSIGVLHLYESGNKAAAYYCIYIVIHQPAHTPYINIINIIWFIIT